MNPIPKAIRFRVNGKTKQKIVGEVLARDQFTCQKCGTGSNLDIPHHIVYKSRYGNDSVDNQITLCRSCHAYVHKWNEKITRNEYNDWVFTVPETKVI